MNINNETKFKYFISNNKEITFKLKVIYFSILTILIIISFFINYILASEFFRLGVMNQWDVVFDADPIKYLNQLANGWGEGKRNDISHINYSNFFNPIVRAISKVILWPSSHTDEITLRKQLVIFIMPLASMLQTILIYLIMRRLSFTPSQALIFTALGIVSFSQIIFGSLPESFCISSLAITYGILLTIDTNKNKFQYFSTPWICLQLFAIGITITNIIPISILHFSKLYRLEPKLWKSLMRTTASALIAIILTILISFIFNLIYHAPNPDTNNSNMVRKDHFSRNPIQRFIAFPNALENTIVAAQPRLVENEIAIQHQHQFPYRFTFNEEEPSSILKRPLAIALLAAIFIGGTIFVLGPPIEKSMGLALFGIVGYNWVLHSFWGSTELFLYSGHWLVPELILLAGFFRLPIFSSKLMLLLSTAIIVGVSVNNIMVINFILVKLSI